MDALSAVIVDPLAVQEALAEILQKGCATVTVTVAVPGQQGRAEVLLRGHGCPDTLAVAAEPALRNAGVAEVVVGAVPLRDALARSGRTYLGAYVGRGLRVADYVGTNPQLVADVAARVQRSEPAAITAEA